MNLEGLYDMVGYKPASQKDKLNEQELKRAIKNNKNLCRRNKDMYEESEECFTECIRYNPCPICDKCLNKGSHLYVKCERCQIPICTHTYNDRKLMIRRDNFEVKLYPEMLKQLRALPKRDI